MSPVDMSDRRAIWSHPPNPDHKTLTGTVLPVSLQFTPHGAYRALWVPDVWGPCFSLSALPGAVGCAALRLPRHASRGARAHSGSRGGNSRPARPAPRRRGAPGGRQGAGASRCPAVGRVPVRPRPCPPRPAATTRPSRPGAVGWDWPDAGGSVGGGCRGCCSDRGREGGGGG